MEFPQTGWTRAHDYRPRQNAPHAELDAIFAVDVARAAEPSRAKS